ncbi:MAG: hypothetical protein JRN20_14625 [Nitrososphaerota archaeon]|nr:hypothetical protein [Nitrososphaerota archaeon]
MNFGSGARKWILVPAIILLFLAGYSFWTISSPLSLLVQPSYQFFNDVQGSFEIKGNNFTVDAVIQVFSTPSVAVSNPATFWVLDLLVPTSLVSIANISKFVITPDSGFALPVKHTPDGKSLVPASVSLTLGEHSAIDQIWSGKNNVVYFESGTFGAYLNAYIGNDTIPKLGTPLTNIGVHVGGQDLTFSYVSNVVNISLTCVIVAFVLLEFGREIRDHKRSNHPDTKLDKYI